MKMMKTMMMKRKSVMTEFSEIFVFCNTAVGALCFGSSKLRFLR